MKHVLTAAALAGVMAGLTALMAMEPADVSLKTLSVSDPEPGLANQEPASSPADLAPVPDSQVDRIIQRYAVDWLAQYGEYIHDPAVQVRLLDVRLTVMADHPSQGQMIFERALWLAFPEFAGDILLRLQKMADYRDWLASNDLTLNSMNYLEREGTKWAKRRALFGADAELIWAAEKTDWNNRKQALQQAIATLGQANQNSLEETLFQLQSELDEIYGLGMQRIGLSKSIVSRLYFGFDSVQARLKEMPADARQQQINQVRAQLGYSDEEIRQLAERDQIRNQRWENGLAYMAERRRLSQQQTGAELEQSLESLRARYFTHEAVTISREEQDGFFRYERPRYYGRN